MAFALHLEAILQSNMIFSQGKVENQTRKFSGAPLGAPLARYKKKGALAITISAAGAGVRAATVTGQSISSALR